MNTKRYQGQIFFTMMSHRLYDFLVYKIVSPLFWGVTVNEITRRYKQNIGGRHLEAGVGTGYLLERVLSDAKPERLTLMDLNQECLIKAAAKLSAYQPNTQRQDVLKPFDLGTSELVSFDSVSMNYVLHCVPGDFKNKEVVFEHVRNILAEDGVFFGMTLLNDGVDRNLAARLLMRVLNLLGIFHNQQDSLHEFSSGLKSHFPNAEIAVKGAAVLWQAVK